MDARDKLLKRATYWLEWLIENDFKSAFAVSQVEKILSDYSDMETRKRHAMEAYRSIYDE